MSKTPEISTSSFGDELLIPVPCTIRSEDPNRENNTVLLEKRAKAYLAQRYPLTSEGKTLRGEVVKALGYSDTKRVKELGIYLPTVENPQLHLFKDLECTPEQEEQLFGWDLANVQCTAGCTHDCLQCSTPPAEKMEIMPYAAVLKISEKMREQEAKKDDLWASWTELIRNGTGIDLEEVERQCASRGISYPFAGFLEKYYPTLIPFVKSEYTKHPIKYTLNPSTNVDYLLVKRAVLRKVITNYYNNDVFDYADKTFPHEDGTPADYGDVFAACASDARPVHVTTAGWSRKNKPAKRAADKVMAACRNNPHLKDMIRISVSSGERRVCGNPDDYREDMKEVIKTLMQTSTSGLRDNIIFYSDPKDPPKKEYLQKVAWPLEAFIVSHHMPIVITSTDISHFSGRQAREDSKGDHDGAACMPGIHVWPDGTIAYQAYTFNGHARMEVKKGERPRPTGAKIYRLDGHNNHMNSTLV